MDVNGCPATLNEVRFLEHIQCKISLRFFPRGNLRIDLTSPMGTTSTLLFERPRDVVSSNFDDWPFLSVHFWGEKVEGRWTLRIHNNGNRHVNQPGKWSCRFTDINSEEAMSSSTLLSLEKVICRLSYNCYKISPAPQVSLIFFASNFSKMNSKILQTLVQVPLKLFCNFSSVFTWNFFDISTKVFIQSSLKKFWNFTDVSWKLLQFFS